MITNAEKPKNIDEGVYEPEMVQLCPQGLILRENGFECESGYIYFDESQQKVKVEFTPELILRTIEFLMRARRVLTRLLILPRALRLVNLSRTKYLIPKRDGVKCTTQIIGETP